MEDRIAQVLDFWLGRPAATSAELDRKVVRWFLTGAAMDKEILEKFGHIVVQAMSGYLDGWARTPAGRLALVIVLDQLTRHVFRGHPRMYDGDATAQSLALEGFALGEHRAMSAEEQLFLTMPLVHAENLALQERAVALVRAQVDAAPLALRPALEKGYERVCYYRTLIGRFGRFPTRNVVFGRPSTPDEDEFLGALRKSA